MFKKFRKIFLIGLATLLLVPIVAPVEQVEAAQSVIYANPSTASRLGSSFSRTTIMSRADTVKFSSDIKRIESDSNLVGNFQFGAATALLFYPLKSLGLTITTGGAASVLGSFIINNNFGSRAIDKALSNYTAKSFTIWTTYTRITRGRDSFYKISSVTIAPRYFY